jgi:site-specific recombinase XerD
VVCHWRRDEGFQDERLENLASRVPDLLSKARAPNTNKAYLAAFNRWVIWAADFPEVTVLPAKAVHIVLYLSHLSSIVKNFASVNQFVSAVTWMHAINNHNSPMSNPVVIEVINGLKRSLAGPVVHKEPFTPEHILRFVTVMNKKSLTDVRNTLMILVAFFAFLRVDELIHIKLKDISIHNDHVQINLPQSKTDQLRQGLSVVVAKIEGPGCPVNLLHVYLSMAGIKISKVSDKFLFTRILFKKGKLQLFKPNEALSYTNVRDVVKNKANQIGLNAALYSTHSMRAGGATAAAEANVPERLMQKHGRWASSVSKDRYVKDGLGKRLKVSAQLLN